MSTYVSGITHTVIDYVTCHPYIASLVGSVEALRHTDPTPRLPVCLTLSAFVPDTPVTVLRTPPRHSLLPMCVPQNDLTAVDARLVEGSAAFSEAFTTLLIDRGAVARDAMPDAEDRFSLEQLRGVTIALTLVVCLQAAALLEAHFRQAVRPAVLAELERRLEAVDILGTCSAHGGVGAGSRLGRPCWPRVCLYGGAGTCGATCASACPCWIVLA